MVQNFAPIHNIWFLESCPDILVIYIYVHMYIYIYVTMWDDCGIFPQRLEFTPAYYSLYIYTSLWYWEHILTTWKQSLHKNMDRDRFVQPQGFWLSVCTHELFSKVCPPCLLQMVPPPVHLQLKSSSHHTLWWYPVIYHQTLKTKLDLELYSYDLVHLSNFPPFFSFESLVSVVFMDRPLW